MNLPSSSYTFSYYENLGLVQFTVINLRKKGVITRTTLDHNLSQLLEACELDSAKYFTDLPLLSRVISVSFPYHDMNKNSAEIVKEIEVTLNEAESKMIMQAYWRIFLGDVINEIEQITKEWESQLQARQPLNFGSATDQHNYICNRKLTPSPTILLGLYIKYDSFTVTI